MCISSCRRSNQMHIFVGTHNLTTLPSSVRPAIPCLPRPRRSSIVLAYGLTECRSSGLTAGPLILAQTQRQKFLEGRGAGRENLFPKRFPSPQAFLPSNLQASACHPPNKKIPGGAGTKKDPLALRAARGSSNNLWQRPTFPHDVMQYHRRWRA